MSLGGAYEQWNGRGWPGELQGDDVPLPARLAQLAEFTEVAHRVGGVDAATELARARAGTQFDPNLADAHVLRRRADLRRARRSRNLGGGDRRRAGAPARPLRGRVRRRAARDRGFHRPEVAVHPRTCACGRRARGRGRRHGSTSPRRRFGRCGAPGSFTTSGGSASRTRSGTSPARSAPASGSGCGFTRT